jgi:hypothetical protein
MCSMAKLIRETLQQNIISRLLFSEKVIHNNVKQYSNRYQDYVMIHTTEW